MHAKEIKDWVQDRAGSHQPSLNSDVTSNWPSSQDGMCNSIKSSSSTSAGWAVPPPTRQHPQDHTTSGQASTAYCSWVKLVIAAASIHETPPNNQSDFSNLSPIYFSVYGDFRNFSRIWRFYFSLLFQLHVSLTACTSWLADDWRNEEGNKAMIYYCLQLPWDEAKLNQLFVKCFQ